MNPFTIRQLLLVMAVLPSVTVAACLGWYLTATYLSELRDDLRERAEASSRLLAVYADQALAAGRTGDLQLLVDNALEEPGVRAVRILDSDRHPLARAGTDMQQAPLSTQAIRTSTGETSYRLSRPIYSGDSVGSQLQGTEKRQLRGWVEMEYARYGYNITKYRTFLATGAVALLALTLVVAFASLLSRRITGGIDALRRGAQAVAHGFYDTHFHVQGNSELKQLASDLNAMTAAARKTFRDLQDSIEQSDVDLRETMETLEVQNIELDLARSEAVKANRIKSEFLANTSHEIRTPLNGIIGFTNILLRSESDPRKRESLTIVKSSAESLLTIINDLLDFSKLEAGKLVLDHIPVNLRELTEDVLGMLAPNAHEKRLEIALFVDERLPEAVMGDPLRLKQIVTNLVSNAIKFTDEGYVRVTMRTGDIDADRATVTVEVSDSGIGLSREQQSRIFQAFAQADASTSRRFGGTGLGLVIVKRLVQQMGGEVGVASEEGKGASFWFTLKLPLVHNSVPSRPFQRLSGRRAAIYDRRTMSRSALRQTLERWGITVTVHDTIESLLSRSAGTDVMICGLDENEAKTLPEDILQCRQPVVVLTPSPEGVAPSERYRCLSQPASQAQLFDVIHEVLSRNEAAPVLSRGEAPQRRIPQRTVLAVDDNAANLKMLALLLKEHDVEVVTVASGVEAIDQCRRRTFDAVFLDLHMPGMDGLEIARRIREIKGSRETSIIALSACAAPEHPERLRSAGIDAYCSKPLNDRQLEDLLSRAPAGRHRDLSVDGEPVDSSTSATAPVDIAQCLAMTRGNIDTAQEMLSMLIRMLPTTVEQLQRAAEEEDIETLRETNHQLRGACCYIGVPVLRSATRELESRLTGANTGETLTKLIAPVVAALMQLDEWQQQHDLEALFEMEAPS